MNDRNALAVKKSRELIQNLFSRQLNVAYPFFHREKIFWIEPHPDEPGHHTLANQDQSGLTPSTHDIATTVHEYGGKCFAVSGNRFIYSNKKDSGIYVLSLEDDGGPQPLTTSSGSSSVQSAYADFEVFDNNTKMLAVREKKFSDRENENTIAYFALDSSQPVEPLDIVTGSDFFASPKVSPDGKRLAWLAWDHPDMPWDAARLMLADLEINGNDVEVGPARRIAGGCNSSVCQSEFLSDGHLCFAMDQDANEDSPQNFWNLYTYRDEAGIEALTDDLTDYGEPLWNFGSQRWVELQPGTLVAIRTSDAGDDLVEIKLDQSVRRLDLKDYQSFGDLHAGTRLGQREILFVGGAMESEHELVCCNLETQTTSVIRSVDPVFPKSSVSCPTSIWFDTRDGDKAHTYYYKPKEECEIATTKPPLLVVVHGGPTARSYGVFDGVKQFWVSLGFALIDVNHRGSSGFGRSYRNKLRGNWGVQDIDDVADAIDFIVKAGLADASKVFIRGKSAGGFASLRLVTEYPDKFCAASLYYGIGNLATLAKTTHKFESRYMDSLLGESYREGMGDEQASVYVERSPVGKIDKISCALILFQGQDDKVVPPELSRELAAALKKKGIQSKYVEYEGEGHGFRRLNTKIDSLLQEASFFYQYLNQINE